MTLKLTESQAETLTAICNGQSVPARAISSLKSLERKGLITSIESVSVSDPSTGKQAKQYTAVHVGTTTDVQADEPAPRCIGTPLKVSPAYKDWVSKRLPGDQLPQGKYFRSIQAFR